MHEFKIAVMSSFAKPPSYSISFSNVTLLQQQVLPETPAFGLIESSRRWFGQQCAKDPSRKIKQGLEDLTFRLEHLVYLRHNVEDWCSKSQAANEHRVIWSPLQLRLQGRMFGSSEGW